MAMSPAAPVQIQATAVKPAEPRPSREGGDARGDFGSELKRELNRDRGEDRRVESPTKPMPKDKATENKAPSSGDDDAEIVQAATVDPWLAMLQGAFNGKVSAEPPSDIGQPSLDLNEQNQAKQGDGALVLDVASNAVPLFNTVLSQTTLASTAVEDQNTTAATVNTATPLLDLNLLQSDSADAASLAVDAAKIMLTQSDTKSVEPMFGSELKAQITPINEPRSPLTVNPAQANTKPVEVPVHHIATPVGESRWGDAVAQRVGLMLGRQEQKIEMQLNPPNLGPMEVRLNLAQDQASVVFSSQSAAVREALAAAMPRLTALLAEQGFTLTNVQVASDSLQQHQQNQNQQAASGSGFNQQNANRDVGGVYAAQAGIDDETLQELGALRLPVAKGGLSLFV